MTPNTDALMRLRAIKPHPLYLLFIMRAMGLFPPPALVAADAVSIAAAAGWDAETTRGHLRQLLAMLYAGKVNARAWYITEAGLLLINPESGSFLLSGAESGKLPLSALVSSSLNNESNLSYLTTTTNSESGKLPLSANPNQNALEAPPAAPTPPAPQLDPDVARLANILHNEHGTAMRYALEACQNALADGSPVLVELAILCWAEYLIENSRGVRNRAALVSHAVGRGELPPAWWLEQYRPKLADAEVYEADYEKLTLRQKRIVDLEFERKALATVMAENTPEGGTDA